MMIWKYVETSAVQSGAERLFVQINSKHICSFTKLTKHDKFRGESLFGGIGASSSEMSLEMEKYYSYFSFLFEIDWMKFCFSSQVHMKTKYYSSTL